MPPQTAPSNEPEPLSHEEFDALLEGVQVRLKSYIASILGSWTDVDDLLQETNLVLIRKREIFTPGTNFIAWAFRIAYFRVGTWRRDRFRENRAMLSESIYQQLAAHAEDRFTEAPDVVDALSECLAQLPAEDAELINFKYVENASLTDYAKSKGKSANSLHKAISRIRLALRNCVHRKLQNQE